MHGQPTIGPPCSTTSHAKEGFASPNDIYGPYHRAFGTPFKRLGDFSIGLDASWVPSIVGVYAGAYYKSQEICFMANDQNLRGNYFQPRAGLVIGGQRTALEAGVFYDFTVGCTGTSQVFGTPNKDMIASGLGLDFAISYANNANSRKVLLMFSMPLHNFLNEDYTGGMLKGKVRKVGYLMLTHRIIF